MRTLPKIPFLAPSTISQESLSDLRKRRVASGILLTWEFCQRVVFPFHFD